jgi:hypothetical protein
MQLLDDALHPDAADPKTSCGALYGLLAPVDKPPLHAGRYHSAGLVVRDAHVEHWLDGRCVLRYDLGDDQLKAQIAGSKFKDMPRFAREPRGLIVLQHHGTDAWFRNVAIEPLGAG